MPFLIDTHCHLHFPSYTPDQRDAALLRMKEKDIWGITVGTSAKTSREAIAFAEAHENIFATVGHHPEHLTSSFHDESEGEIDDYDAQTIADIAASSKKVVGIGETGLDFFRIDPERNIDEAKQMQEKAFREHIELALRLDKPLVIHCREALPRLAEILKSYSLPPTASQIRGVVHCFTGTWEEAKPLLDLGLYLAFGGIITFPPKKTQDPETHIHRVIERMPIEQMLVETDAPWLTPIPHRGEQNEPSYVEFVAQKIAELRGMTLEDVARVTTENAKRLFRI